MRFLAIIFLSISLSVNAQRLPTSGPLAMSDILDVMLKLEELEPSWLFQPYTLKMLVDSSRIADKSTPVPVSRFYGYPPLYYSEYQDTVLTRNNCASPNIGTNGIYWVPAGSYTSVVSQTDADQKAKDDMATWAQMAINGIPPFGGSGAYRSGTCVPPPPPGTNNKITLDYIRRLVVNPLGGWYFQLYISSSYPVTSNLTVQVQVNGVNGGSVTVNPTFVNGQSQLVYTSATYDYVNKGVNGSIQLITPSSDSNYNYTF